MKGRFTIVDVPQRSPEWFTARLGRLTGSKAAAMLAKIAKGESAGRRNLRAQLMLERITGKSNASTFQTDAMRQGIEREAAAIGLFEVLTGRAALQSGFLAHMDFAAGCSLDSYLGDYEEIVETKCPIQATHLEYILTGIVPDDYMKQCVHNMWVTGARVCHWLSYNPDFPEPLQSKLVTIRVDEPTILAYEQEVRKFLQEVDAVEAKVRRMMVAT